MKLTKEQMILLQEWEQLNWLINRFNMDVEHALDTMIRYKQDMTFLIDYVDRHRPLS